MSKLAGIEIGGTKLQIVAGTPEGRIYSRQFFEVDLSRGADGIKEKIVEALDNFGEDIKGIGIGFGGPIDRITGEIKTSYHVQGWTGFNLVNWLKNEYEVPVTVDNDANVAALGEAVCGAGINSQTVFYATLGSGVGGGLVVNKAIYHGSLPGEVEFGHIRLDKSGKTVQSSCAGWSVNEKLKVAAATKPSSRLAKEVSIVRGAEAKALNILLKTGDAEALRIFDETMDDLSFGLSHVVHLFHPDIIVLGGGLSNLGEVLVRSVSERLPGFVMDAFHPCPPVRLAALRTDAVPVGALVLAGSVSNRI